MSARRDHGLSGGSLHHQYAAASSLRAVSTGIYPAAGVASFPNPTGEFPTRLTSLEGIQGNGKWSLYVKDNAAGTGGVIASGWTLTAIQPTGEPGHRLRHGRPVVRQA